MGPDTDTQAVQLAARQRENGVLRSARCCWASLILMGPLLWLPAKPRVADAASLVPIVAMLVIAFTRPVRRNTLLQLGAYWPLLLFNAGLCWWPAGRYLAKVKMSWPQALPLHLQLVFTGLLLLAAACSTCAVCRLPATPPVPKAA